jgi:ParB/Sulfiredoxin domain
MRRHAHDPGAKETQMTAVQRIAIGALKPNARNARTHPKKQVQQIAASVRAFGFVVPILIDEDRTILAGHGRYAAAQLLGMTEVPVIEVRGLSAAKKRALALADNKIGENAGWDREILAAELPELADLLVEEGLDVSITGFAPVEIDQIATDFEEDTSDPADSVDPRWLPAAAVSKPGDLWQLGHHRILCGDARDRTTLARLVAESRAAMAFCDPPYNRRVRDIVGRGRIKHSEFAMGSGELSRTSFVEFLNESLAAAAAVSHEGAVHFVCMDWRGIGELLEAARCVYGEILNLVVWAKSNAGQGSCARLA